MNWLKRVAASPFWPMVRKEFIQLRRDRLTLAMLIGIPSIQLALFGYAIQTEVRHLPTVVVDDARSQESRQLVAALVNTTNFDIVSQVQSREEAHREIVSGRARAALIIPPDFTRDVKRGRPAEAQVLVDAADPLASSAAIGGAAQAGTAFSQSLAGDRASAAVLVRVRPLFNPTLRSAVYIVPGIIGVLLSMTLVIIMSVSVVRERERGTLEQLIVTPIDRTSLLLGKIVPFVIIGFVQMTIVLFLGRLLFDVPLRGSILLLYAIALPFIVATLAVGLVVSAAVKTQAQAMQMGFMFLLPNILLSGFMFPREAMPVVAQWIGAALPLTYFLQVIRAILLRDAGLTAVWPQALVLVAFSVGLVTLAVRKFHKTLE